MWHFLKSCNFFLHANFLKLPCLELVLVLLDVNTFRSPSLRIPDGKWSSGFSLIKTILPVSMYFSRVLVALVSIWVEELARLVPWCPSLLPG